MALGLEQPKAFILSCGPNPCFRFYENVFGGSVHKLPCLDVKSSCVSLWECWTASPVPLDWFPIDVRGFLVKNTQVKGDAAIGWEDQDIVGRDLVDDQIFEEMCLKCGSQQCLVELVVSVRKEHTVWFFLKLTSHFSSKADKFWIPHSFIHFIS